MSDNLSSSLPPHVADTVRAIQQIHADHHDRATASERMASRVTAVIGRPAFSAALTLLIVGWVTINILLGNHAAESFVGPHIPWLADAATLCALYIALLILMTQRRADILASRREQLTLQLAILSEQKSGKIIALLEELRRDHPQIQNRHDAEAAAMSSPSDPQAVSKVLEELGPDDGIRSGRPVSKDQ